MIDFKSATCKTCETKIVTSTSSSFSCACAFVTCTRCGIVKEGNYCKECDKEKPRILSGSWAFWKTMSEPIEYLDECTICRKVITATNFVENKSDDDSATFFLADFSCLCELYTCMSCSLNSIKVRCGLCRDCLAERRQTPKASYYSNDYKHNGLLLRFRFNSLSEFYSKNTI